MQFPFKKLCKVTEENILKRFPEPEELDRIAGDRELPDFREANGHIHTPFSFSAFSRMEEVFSMAKDENIAALGINDFYVTDGYHSFYTGCLANGIFPLFNIEFIGLLGDEQRKGIRINDPNNPGRIYFSGKGLDFPYHLRSDYLKKLEIVREETQNQLRLMTDKLNSIIARINPSLILIFDEIKRKYARELVRERHLAKAVRSLLFDYYSSDEGRLEFLESIYGGKKSKAGLADPASLENEIRSNLLKAGGGAFVEEDESSFMNLQEIIDIITDAGGIPCYPVLLDDPSGKCTEFEQDSERLSSRLKEIGVGCVELIPGRNDQAVLERFATFFDARGFVVTFGTEHNTPEMMPLTVSSRGKVPLSDNLKRINWRGISVLAAHQYYRARGREGYIGKEGKAKVTEKNSFERTGRSVIEYFLKNQV